MKYRLKSWFLSKVPLLTKNFKCNVFVGRSCLEFYNTVVRALSCLQIILRCLLLIVEIRVEDIELVALDSFGGRVVFWIMHGVVFVPLDCDPFSIDVLWLQATEASLSFARNPVIEFLFVLLHALVLLKFNDLFSYEIISLSRLINDVGTQ